ncbi:metallophosphoesterase [Bacillus sp. CDB3]|uniref:metallophosphoesterase n=1 Tax=Bacillus sp. CDB3 TaxID=360310 RepID=UPI0015C4D3B7|nr:metallophosphoesterase [Bacillus sp. CDB3]
MLKLKMMKVLLCSAVVTSSFVFIGNHQVSAKPTEVAYQITPMVQKGAITILSDPQYPWTAKTDAGQSETNAEQEEESKKLIISQFTSAAEYGRDFNTRQGIANDRPLPPMLINGDITAFGHGWQRKLMTMYINNVKKNHNQPVYYGLGNHDIENNVRDCANNGCLIDTMDMYTEHVKSLVSSGANFDMSKKGSHSTGSFAYSIDYGPLHLVQLNQYPTYMFDEKKTVGSKRYTMQSPLDNGWLEADLKAAQNKGQTIIVNLHKPNDWKGGPSQKFKDLLTTYNVKAIFAGHYHTLSGKIDGTYDYFANVPVFLSGSASQKTFLTVEYELGSTKRLNVYKVMSNDWRNKTLIHTITG